MWRDNGLRILKIYDRSNINIMSQSIRQMPFIRFLASSSVCTEGNVSNFRCHSEKSLQKLPTKPSNTLFVFRRIPFIADYPFPKKLCQLQKKGGMNVNLQFVCIQEVLFKCCACRYNVCVGVKRNDIFPLFRCCWRANFAENLLAFGVCVIHS